MTTPPPIRRVHEVLAFENRFVRLYNDDVCWDSGKTGTHVRLVSGDGLPGVVIVPLHRGKLGLVHVYRYPLESWQWGFPRGFAQSADVLETAAGELLEEMGLAGRLAVLGWFSPDSGVQAVRVAVVCAEIDNPRGTPVDVGEVDDVRWLDPEELLGRLGSDEFDDGMTMSALALAMARGVVER